MVQLSTMCHVESADKKAATEEERRGKPMYISNVALLDLPNGRV